MYQINCVLNIQELACLICEFIQIKYIIIIYFIKKWWMCYREEKREKK